MKVRIVISFLLILGIAGGLQARENKDDNKKRKSSMKALADGCAAATSSADLSINNVRTRILGSGDMWWDLNDAKYEVPKGSNKHSMFAGALWLGGYDEADQLRMAAMTYRGRGVDYWPGPLSDDNTASVTAETCERYNRHWVIYREDVDTHAEWVRCKVEPDCEPAERFPNYEANIPEVIREWPGNGIDGELPNKLAPYYETDHPDNNLGEYDYQYDYPGYDIDGNEDCQAKEVDLLYGDETIWWVYNDKGNVHTETQAAALGFEIRAQAFAFASNDEVNNMTFNNYRIINKSTFRLTDTYFGTWFDPDLGNHTDDIIGCDIARGLGYCYNGEAVDAGPNGYGANPPAIGFDFFQGPFADYFDGVDNDRDGCIDGVRGDDGACISENPATGVNERIIMSGFMYYNNGSTTPLNATSDPGIAQEFYNLLNSRWKGGNNLIIETPSGKLNAGNGDGYVPSNNGTATKFAYPGLSYDTTGAYEPSSEIPNGGWWESPENAADKRGLHSAGPFSLSPGALNFITTGTVWARNFSGNDLFASVDQVIIADDKAQQLFDNCFNVLDGPDSPELEIVELDKELVLTLKNAFTSRTIGYEQVDPAIRIPDTVEGQPIPFTAARAREIGYSTYRFEGFQIFQVDGPDVSVGDLYDRSRSRLIWQSDIKNDIGQLVNFEVDPDLQNNALIPQDMTLQANNDGIELSFSVKEDAFATGNARLVNNREYYFYVIAYSQNQYKITDPRNLAEPSQKKPYLAGRRIGNGQKPYLGIPNERNSFISEAQYGDGLPISRFSGAGNSGNFVRITDETRNEIAVERKIDQVDYLRGSGPLDVKVVDPTEVVAGNYLIEFTGVSANSGWRLVNAETDQLIDSSEFSISFLGEQIIDEIGISIALRNPEPPGFDEEQIRNNGVIGGDITFSDPRKNWLTGIQDNDTYTPENWIFGGNNYTGDGTGSAYNERPGQGAISPDPHGEFETILNGTWGPMLLTSDVELNIDPTTPPDERTPGGGVRPAVARSQLLSLGKMPNVDIVITRDPSKWTRVPVFELGDLPENNEGGQEKFFLRTDPTLNKNADGTLSPVSDPDAGKYGRGWSYFPGYAVNVITGRRLHMAFGENSWLKSENGGDMLWNPSANIRRKLGSYGLGGMHIVYVFTDSTVLSGNTIDLTYREEHEDPANHPLIEELDLFPTQFNFRAGRFFGAMSWVGFPLLTEERYAFNSYNEIPTEVLIELRVDRPYQRTDSEDPNSGYPLYGFNTTDLASGTFADLETEKSALDLIKVVPNPYNGSSEYERSQLENIVKITNLPAQCKINIFMTNGTLVRSITKDNNLTFAEWDLKNDFNVPIASGIYLIHIDAGAAGQKVVKWIGSLRPVDLNAF